MKPRNSEFHLTPAELSKLLQQERPLRDQVMIELFVYTGIRRAEVQAVQKEDIDFKRSRLLVRRGKGGKQRVLYIPNTLLQKLHNLCRETASTFLFPGRSGDGMSLRNINRITTKAGKQAKLTHPNPRYENISPHLLRHSFARNWKRAGGSLESLQKILGHSSLKTTLDVYGTESQFETERNYHAIVDRLVNPEPSFNVLL